MKLDSKKLEEIAKCANCANCKEDERGTYCAINSCNIDNPKDEGCITYFTPGFRYKR